MTPTEQVAAWNQAHGIGTEVDVTRGDGSVKRMFTTDRAEVRNDQAVIWLGGAMGGFPLAHVKAVDEENSPEVVAALNALDLAKRRLRAQRASEARRRGGAGDE